MSLTPSDYLSGSSLAPSPLACVVLAAGKGTRMRSDIPKVLHQLGGIPILNHVLAMAEKLEPTVRLLVVGPGMSEVVAAASGWSHVIQQNQDGTGGALRAALTALAGFHGDVLILYGDTPLVKAETLDRLRQALAPQATGAAVACLGMRPADPGAYGRVVLDHASGRQARKIVEYAEASEAERAIGLCNAGLMAVKMEALSRFLPLLKPSPKKGEYYLTDLVELADAAGERAICVETDDASEVMGVNSKAELATAESVLQGRLRSAALEAGVTLIGPETIFLSADTRFGRDVVIQPHVIIGPGVTLADNVTVKSFSHLEAATVGAGSIVGPFARLRPGAKLDQGVHIGNFVEVKNAYLGRNVKASHLSYLGDTDIGTGTNVGAGTITCNYDGFAKHRATIGENVFVGSNSTLVAPLAVGDGAFLAAGSVVTDDVPSDALALGRARQETKVGWAARFRARRGGVLPAGKSAKES